MPIRKAAVLELLITGCLAATLSLTANAQQPGDQRGRQQAGNHDQKPAGQRPAASRPGQKPNPQPANRPGTQPGNKPGQRPGNRPGGQQGARPNPQPGNRPASRLTRPQNQHRPPARQPSRRPAQWGRPPARRPSYNFRPGDRDRLRGYYASRFGSINRVRRPIFRMGGYFPYGEISYLSPLPPDLYGYMPPPPPGYQMGYYDGYVVVYDPLTYFIANVIDLLQ